MTSSPAAKTKKGNVDPTFPGFRLAGLELVPRALGLLGVLESSETLPGLGGTGEVFKVQPHRLFSGHLKWHNRDQWSFTFVYEGHVAIRQRKQCVVNANAHVVTGVKLGSALTYNNVACAHGFAAEALHAEAL
jgi:hypothetical protein